MGVGADSRNAAAAGGRRRGGSACAVTVAFALVSGCSTKTEEPSGSGAPCPLLGCLPPLVLHVPVPGTYEELKTDRIELCQNGQCISGSLAGLGAPPSGGTLPYVDFPPTDGGTGRANAQAFVLAGPGSGFSLEIDYFADVADGDHYVFRIVDPAEATLYSLDRTVKYEWRRPNGPRCDPVPCGHADIDARPDGGPNVL